MEGVWIVGDRPALQLHSPYWGCRIFEHHAFLGRSSWPQQVLRVRTPCCWGISFDVGSLDGTTILLVDDDPLLRRGLRRGLESEGAEVIGASTMQEGLEQLDSPIDVLITDVNLGDASGVELAREAAARLPSVPVLAISGEATIADAFALGRAGVAGILEKPFGVEALVAAVSGLVPPIAVELEVVARRLVGSVDLGEVLDRVRRAMVNEALERSDQTKSHAAAELGISRQHLQKLLERGQA